MTVRAAAAFGGAMRELRLGRAVARLWRMRSRVPLAVRLSLIFGVATALTLILCALLLRASVEEQFQRHDREELQGKMQVLRDLLRNASSYEEIKKSRELLRGTLLAGHPHSAIVVVGADGADLLAVGRDEVIRSLIGRGGAPGAGLVTWTYEDRNYRVTEENMPLGMAGEGPARVLISFDVTENLEFFREFKDALWIFALGGSLLAGELGWILVRKGLSPLHDLSALLANMSTDALGRPIPLGDAPTDLRELILSFNRMMLRLNESFQRLAEFSSEIAHELRTPLNNMMLQAQVVLAQRRDTNEYCSYLQSNLEELRRLSRMVENMLFLAKADNRLLAPRFEEFDLTKEIAKIVEFFEIAANDQSVRIVQTGQARSLVADRLMVQRALSNIISNALRFTPKGEVIAVDVREDSDGLHVCISNPGPEIAPEHLQKVFERFYRVDASRREGQTVNVGLGLAITKSIMEIHGGTVLGESREGLTRFKLNFPKDTAYRHAQGRPIEHGAFGMVGART